MRIIKSHKLILYDLTEEQKREIKNALTFDNPKYRLAKNFSRNGYTSIPPYLRYYKECVLVDELGKKEKSLEIPIGFNLEKYPVENIEDYRVKKDIKYPPFNLTLREDQQKAKEGYLNEVYNNETPKNIIQLATGKGKTIVALNIAYTLKQKTLILVHKDDLVVGWTKDIKKCFGENIEIGLLKAQKRKVGDCFTIATVQTLSRMSEEELNKYTNQFGLVIQDEVHHIGLNIFNVIDKFKSFYKLGLSATPQRSDGLDFVFELFFGGIAYKYEYTVNDKDILRAKVIIQNSNFKYKPFLYKGVVYNYYDFEEKDLPKNISFISDLPYEERPIIPYLTIDNSVVSSKPHKIQICRDIISEYRQGHSCIALFTQKEHIDLYYKYLCRYIPKEKIMLYYGDNKEKSDVLMERAESREVLITLATYAKATEGTNVKAWEVEFLVSSINSKKNVEQAVGRIRRNNKGKLDPVRIYDYRVTGYSISKHINTRIGVYKELKFIIEDLTATKEPQGLFSRGYK